MAMVPSSSCFLVLVQYSFDLFGALVQRKEVVIRVRVRQDVQQKFSPRPRFEFSPLVSVTDELQYEKVHGLYTACGMLGWWRVVGGVGRRSTL
ncbi:hypothetical protein ACLB2K_025755 [Fragaria x ananassa]